MMMQSMGGRCSRTRCIRGSPLLMLGEIQRVRSVRVRETGQKLAVVSRRYAMPSMHCSCSMHRAASRRAAPVRPPVGEIATRDRIHIITGERGSCSISHIAHRVIASHGRRLAASRMRPPCILHALCAHSLSLSLSLSPYSCIGWIDSDFTQHRDRMAVRRISFLIKDRRDQGMVIAS